MMSKRKHFLTWCISAAAGFAIAVGLVAAQDKTPDSVLGTADGQYELFTPAEVVAAGGGGGDGGNVPTPPNSGKFLLEATDGTAEWQSLNTALEEELFVELQGQSDPGSLLRIRSVDTGGKRITLGTQSAAATVLGGVPSLTGNEGNCFVVNTSADGFLWVKCTDLSDALPKDVGTTSAGTATTVSRSDHAHGGAAALATATAKPIGTAAAGTSTDAARGDHVHGILQVSGSDMPLEAQTAAALGTRPVPARSDHVHPTILPAQSGSNRLFMLGRNSTEGAPSAGLTWVRAGDVISRAAGNPAANKDKCVKVNAAGNGYEFGDCEGGGGGPPLSDANPQNIGTKAPGTSTDASRADHVHALLLSTDNPSNPAATPSAGTSNVPARSDHAHLAELPTVTGHGGNFLAVNASATGVEWKAVSGGGGGGGGGGCTVEDIHTFTLPKADSSSARIRATLSGDDAAAVYTTVRTKQIGDSPWNFIGVRTENAGYEGQSMGAVVPAKPLGSDYAAGSSIQFFLRMANGPQPPAERQAWIFVGSTFTAFNMSRITAQSNDFTTRDETWVFYGMTCGGGGPSIPNPTAAGALKHLRVNAAGAAYELADPPKPGALIKSIKSGSNVSGTEDTYARTDHEHSIPGTLYGTPVAVGTANAAGTATTLARADHVHKGDGSAPGFSKDIPTPDGLGSPGLKSSVARSDHSHPEPSGWTEFIDQDNEAIELLSEWVTNAVIDSPPPSVLAADLKSGAADVRIGIYKGSTLWALCEANWNTEGTENGYINAAPSSSECTGTNISGVQHLEYYPDPKGTDEQEYRILYAGNQSGVTFTITVEVFVPRNDEDLLWQATHTATQWGGGQNLGSGVNKRIFDGFSGDAVVSWRQIIAEIKYTQSGSPGTDHYGILDFGTYRAGNQKADNKVAIYGSGRLRSAELHATITLSQPTAFNSNTGSLALGNCTWCQGGERIEITLWGVR